MTENKNQKSYDSKELMNLIELLIEKVKALKKDFEENEKENLNNTKIKK